MITIVSVDTKPKLKRQDVKKRNVKTNLCFREIRAQEDGPFAAADCMKCSGETVWSHLRRQCLVDIGDELNRSPWLELRTEDRVYVSLQMVCLCVLSQFTGSTTSIIRDKITLMDLSYFDAANI